MTEIDKIVIETLKKRGFEYTAKYVEMFGRENMNPSYWFPCKQSEKFYKKCVEEGHPWDWYFEFPEDSIF